jgi:hypothetical protein
VLTEIDRAENPLEFELSHDYSSLLRASPLEMQFFVKGNAEGCYYCEGGRNAILAGKINSQ